MSSRLPNIQHIEPALPSSNPPLSSALLEIQRIPDCLLDLIKKEKFSEASTLIDTDLRYAIGVLAHTSEALMGALARTEIEDMPLYSASVDKTTK